MKIIITDVDDTILNYVTPFREWMSKKGYEPVIPIGTFYDLAKVYDLEEDKALSLIDEFTHSEEFENLKPEPCARLILPDLYVEGYRFVAITAVTNTPEIQKRRMSNLESAFGFQFEDCICTGLRQPKTPHLHKYRGKSEFWIEDNLHHAIDGAKMGHKTYLLDKTYNQCDQNHNFKRIKNWHDIEKEYLAECALPVGAPL